MTSSKNETATSNVPEVTCGYNEQEIIQTLLEKINRRITKIIEEKNSGKKVIGSAKYKDLELLERAKSIFSLIHGDKFRKEIEKDEEDLRSGRIERSLIETNPLLLSFCQWLSYTDDGHYHSSYFLPNLKDFFIFVVTLCKRLKVIAEIVDIISDPQWKSLKDNKASLLIDGFFIIEVRRGNFLKLDIDIYKIKDLFKICNYNISIAFHRPNYKSPSVKIPIRDILKAKSDSEVKKQLAEKVDFIISFVKFGSTKNDTSQD